MSLKSKIVGYAKRHTFHFVVMIAIGFGIVSHISQYSIIASINKKIDTNHALMEKKINTTKTSILANTDSQDNAIEQRLETFRASIQARVDTIDSAIKPDEKRRALIKSVRDAITENTRREIGIRTLNRIAIAVVDYSYVYNLPIANVLAQMKQESDFNVKAQSHAGAKGLMQIIDPTASDIARELNRNKYNIWDINTNVEFGCYYMAKMLGLHQNNLDDALRAYNFGPHNVAKVKAGGADYSLSKIEVIDGSEVQYLVDKYGKFITDEDDMRVVVKEEHRYPRETRLYVKNIKKLLEVFGHYGLDKVE